jgi:hypothetical protein
MIEFRQGGNPYEIMEVGEHRPYKVGDKVICLKNLQWGFGEWRVISNWESMTHFKEDRTYTIKVNFLKNGEEYFEIRGWSISIHTLKRFFKRA